ncbi:hypothetical protein [Microvirga flavescens]|uniref:hypothetical protein n=1 Tax=Microvirga flavescens TaxID=2249811 RepID=UPI001FE08F76|nr:hypothetical protein [Microvirga flavescens]
MMLRSAGDTAPEYGLVDGSATALEEKVRFLSAASSYPHGSGKVVTKETHMSWIFLGEDKVFKLKKPVRYPYLDFATLEAREFFCREEVRLNRWLASGIYQGVIPLRRSRQGALTLEGEGEIVDWLVVMKRLPAACMLDLRLQEGTVDEHDAERLAEVLANFYRKAEHPQIDPQAPFRRFTHEMAENRAVLTHPGLLDEQGWIVDLLNRVDAALLSARNRLEERASSGHIVDGHGDLRPEHICLATPVVIFDCLEFSWELRLVDPFDELMSLAVECARFDAPWFGLVLIERVARRMGENIPEDLMAVYCALHAVLRARLSLAHLFDPVPREPAKWRPQARRYLELAEKAFDR